MTGNVIITLLKKIKLSVLESTYARQLNIDLDKPIFSFTFDDAPLSAANTGARILEEANTTGTYYLALGLESDKDAPEPLISADDIRSLHLRGHDIQCHTFSHLNLRRHSRQEYDADCEKNRKRITEITKQSHVSHFAYPYGTVSLSAKRNLGKIYNTMRTVDFGINHGLTDVTHLRAIETFSSCIDRQKIKQAIDASVKNNAWAIFFTHDVKDHPTPWGATPEDLQWVVDECCKVDGDILNVRQAYQKITGLDGR